MGDRYRKNELVGAHAEGRIHDALIDQAKFNFPTGEKPTFSRFVILDVIYDPTIIDQVKLDYWLETYGLTNIELASVAPANSIIAQRIANNTNSPAEKPMVLFPFFPPHISLPAKPGEHVWVMFENPDAKMTEIGYWMCRIVGPTYVEDVNHTHLDRALDISFKSDLKAKNLHTGTGKPVYDYRNGAVINIDNERFSSADAVSIESNDDAYATILSNAEASKLTHLESVPRYRKRPGDTALEGTNNTLIVLGRDRIGPVAVYKEDPGVGKIPELPTSDNKNDGSGAVDIVVGRGQIQKTSGNPVVNLTTNKQEIGKTKQELEINEGDPDFKTDKSRIYIAQKTSVDTNFVIDKIFTDISDSPDGNACVVAKSDKIRLIAREDIVILVTNNTGDVNDLDITKCAAIVVKSNGDIVFKPSDTGVVKLGGEDANKAVLCTTVNNGGSNGIVSASPIIDTMAGSQGGEDGLNGVFATKVLLK